MSMSSSSGASHIIAWGPRRQTRRPRQAQPPRAQQRTPGNGERARGA